MSYGVAQLATEFFSIFESEGGAPKALAIRVRGPMQKVGRYRTPGVESVLKGVTGNWAPVSGLKQDVGNEGSQQLGDVQCWTYGPKARLEVPKEATGSPGAILIADGVRYLLYNRRLWLYGTGYEYDGKLMRRDAGV